MGAINTHGRSPALPGRRAFARREGPGGRNAPGSVREKIIIARSIVFSPRLVAMDNIFPNIKQEEKEQIIETTKGVKCWRKSVGIEKVGLYIPGGSAPLFSTILMKMKLFLKLAENNAKNGF